MALNQNNFGIATGRLAKDPVVFNNSDGSKSVRLTVITQNNFKGKDGKRGVTAVPIEAFIPSGKELGAYAHMHKGDLVGIEYTVVPNNYKDKDGNDVYDITLLAKGADLKEAKSVTDARAAKNAESFVADEAADVPFAEDTAE